MLISLQIVAKKVIKYDLVHLKSIRAELTALEKLANCRNVVRWHRDIARDTLSNHIHIHMEYFPAGDLSNEILRRRLAS